MLDTRPGSLTSRGRRVEIDVESRAGTSASDLDEAHAIIESIRTERQANQAARVIYTLASNDWDSG